MKKLMIAAAIVCAAAFVQAASVTWGGAIFMEDGGGEMGIGAVEFFINGSSVGVVNHTGMADFGEWTVNGGDTIKIISTITNFGESGDETGTKTWDYLVTDKWITDWSDAESAKSALGLATTSAMALDAELWQGAAENGYTPAGVPEPTSGLLLLLGVAGLALKRKRA